MQHGVETFGCRRELEAPSELEVAKDREQTGIQYAIQIVAILGDERQTDERAEGATRHVSSLEYLGEGLIVRPRDRYQVVEEAVVGSCVFFDDREDLVPMLWKVGAFVLALFELVAHVCVRPVVRDELENREIIFVQVGAPTDPVQGFEEDRVQAETALRVELEVLDDAPILSGRAKEADEEGDRKPEVARDLERGQVSKEEVREGEAWQKVSVDLQPGRAVVALVRLRLAFGEHHLKHNKSELGAVTASFSTAR